MLNYNLDVLCLTETWFNEECEYCVPPGYKLYRFDRGSRGGGVAILTRAGFKVKIICKLDIDWLEKSCVEYLILKIQISHRRSFIVCTVYKPMSCLNDLQNFESILTYLNTLPNKVFLLGDLNINMLKNYCNSKKIMAVLTRHNFIQIVKAPTRGDSLIDVIIVKNEQDSDIEKVKVMDLRVSDHNFCFCAAQTNLKILRSKTIQRRNFKNINYEMFIPEIVHALQNCCTGGNANVKCYQLINTILSSFDKHAPIENVNTNVKVKFVSSYTKELIVRRDHYYQLWKTSYASYNYCEYKLLNKLIDKSLRRDMYNHTQHMVKNRGPWETIKLFGLHFGKNQGDIGENASLDDVNKFFVNMGFEDGVLPYDTMQNCLTKNDDKTGNFFVQNVTMSELVDAWKGLKNKDSKSPDTMGISKHMLKLLIPIPIVCESILSMFNSSFSSGIVPIQLKRSKVIILPKICNAIKPDEFRPISLNPNLLLWMEKIYSNRLDKHICNNSILKNNQFGFRRYHSTEHMIIGLTDIIRRNIDKGMICAVVSTDFQKAFDSIPRAVLLDKLCKLYNISTHWLKSYLSEREQFVSTPWSNSKILKTLAGVPAGSIIGPKLFILFLNDMGIGLKNGNLSCFADDSYVYFFGNINNLKLLQDIVNQDMSYVVKYVKSNGISLHKDKTKLLLIGSKTNITLSHNFNIIVNNMVINPTDRLKCVGIILDSNFNFEYHINYIAKRAYYRIRCLYAVKQYFTTSCLTTIGIAIVLSILSYMSCIWSATCSKNLRIVENVIRCLARLVLKLKKFDPVANMIKCDLKWLFPRDMGEFKILCIMYKLVKYNMVPFFNEYFKRANSIHEHNTRSCNNFRSIEKPKTEFLRKSFHYRAIGLWNNLPSDITTAQSYDTFKCKLKDYMLLKSM